MIYESSDFIDVESESDFVSPQIFDCIIDPYNPPIQMLIDDNNIFTPTVAAASDGCVIRHVIFKKCKERKHRDELAGTCGDVSPEISQTHVHEELGSVEIAEAGEDAHNHRFATVSNEARFLGNNHVHDVWFRTDFVDGHNHEAWGTTGFAIQVGDRHVHFLEGVTTVDDGHLHNFIVATLIEDPIG